jgi:hypothetical protein
MRKQVQVSLPGGGIMASPEQELAFFISKQYPYLDHIIFTHFASLVSNTLGIITKANSSFWRCSS